MAGGLKRKKVKPKMAWGGGIKRQGGGNKERHLGKIKMPFENLDYPQPSGKR